MSKEGEPIGLQQSALEKVARELLERRDKGDIVIGGAMRYYPLTGGEQVIFAVGPSSPLYDPEEINEFTKGLVKDIPLTQIQPFDSDRSIPGNTYIGILSFSEIKGKLKIASTPIQTLAPIDEQLMQQVGIKLPEDTQRENVKELTRITKVHVYPHPKLAEIAGNHMKRGITDLVSGYFPTKSFKKIRENELKGRPFPVEDFQLPKQMGR